MYPVPNPYTLMLSGPLRVRTSPDQPFYPMQGINQLFAVVTDARVWCEFGVLSYHSCYLRCSSPSLLGWAEIPVWVQLILGSNSSGRWSPANSLSLFQSDIPLLQWKSGCLFPVPCLCFGVTLLPSSCSQSAAPSLPPQWQMSRWRRRAGGCAPCPYPHRPFLWRGTLYTTPQVGKKKRARELER